MYAAKLFLLEWGLECFATGVYFTRAEQQRSKIKPYFQAFPVADTQKGKAGRKKQPSSLGFLSLLQNVGTLYREHGGEEIGARGRWQTAQKQTDKHHTTAALASSPASNPRMKWDSPSLTPPPRIFWRRWQGFAKEECVLYTVLEMPVKQANTSPLS